MASFQTVDVLGLWHVGLPTAVGFAKLGFQVIGTDSDTAQFGYREAEIDEEKLRKILKGLRLTRRFANFMERYYVTRKELFKGKEEIRREIAKLPFEEKIKALVESQKLAYSWEKKSDVVIWKLDTRFKWW